MPRTLYRSTAAWAIQRAYRIHRLRLYYLSQLRQLEGQAMSPMRHSMRKKATAKYYKGYRVAKSRYGRKYTYRVKYS